MKKRFELPESLGKLEELASNLWFSWNTDIRNVFREMDVDLWRKTGHNPAEFLYNIDPLKLEHFSTNPQFLAKLQKCWDRFHVYMQEKETSFSKNFPKMLDHLVAYFSTEYGIHESIPNYAGGLGILAGDHTKSASDIGLPFVAVGLMYKHAYFKQQIDANGTQTEIYSGLDPFKLPIRLVHDDKGKPLLTSVPLLDREVYIKIWEVKVGRVAVFLLDTTVDLNSDEDKDIIHSLYGGSRDTRIRQEIILGIGGMRALRKMRYYPSVFHMNEGHSAFLGLERLYELMNEGMDFKTALEYVRATTVFTTHTPIPAGNEAFEFEMMERYFYNLWPQLEISHEKFFDLGRNTNIHQKENFSLTVLALNLSSQANGVSRLHGEVSRDMWQKVWPGTPVQEVPIGHITNGVHTFTWLHREMIKLLDEYCHPDWYSHIRDQQFWDKIFEIPNQVVWDVMKLMKQDMINHIRRIYKIRIDRYGEQYAGYPAAGEILNPQALTIGFARRFAPYKRALLFFRDMERAKRIVSNSDRPVQILFAGKAHPANEAGKDLIRRINEISKEEDFRGKIIFVEDYNMSNARVLISGVDVWMNTPRRPLEASGTSGQKVPINFGINFSILDGWWLEGYNGQNGWSIGEKRNYEDTEQQDIEDAQSLYDTLENKIIPLYYKQDIKGIPNDWVEKAKLSFHSTITQFSAHNMIWQYLQKYYIPAMKRSEKYAQEDYRELYQFAKWKNRLQRSWKNVHLFLKNGTTMDEDRRILAAGETREIVLKVLAGGLKPKDLCVELIVERQDIYRANRDLKVVPMGLVADNSEGELEYRAIYTADNEGSYHYNCRIVPNHPDLYHPHETRLIKWVD